MREHPVVGDSTIAALVLLLDLSELLVGVEDRGVPPWLYAAVDRKSVV